MPKLLPLGLLVVFVSACGGGSVPATPTSPSAAAPLSSRVDAPAADLTIAGPDVLMAGRTAKYDVTAILTSGVTFYHVTAAWDTDNAAVATISSSGTLTGQRPGTAIITATYRGKSASVPVHVSTKPVSRPFPAQANLVITYDPDPVPGSLVPCGDQFTPSWTYSLRITEASGVGFTLHTGTWNLYDDSGRQIYGGSEPEDEYFAPNSAFVEQICTSLAGRLRGSTDDVLEGVDDNGHRLSFRSSRLTFLPVAGASSALRGISPTPIPARPTAGSPHVAPGSVTPRISLARAP